MKREKKKIRAKKKKDKEKDGNKRGRKSRTTKASWSGAEKSFITVKPHPRKGMEKSQGRRNRT